MCIQKYLMRFGELLVVEPWQDKIKSHERVFYNCDIDLGHDNTIYTI